MHLSTLFVVCLLAFTVCQLTRSVTSRPTESEEDDVANEETSIPSVEVMSIIESRL